MSDKGKCLSYGRLRFLWRWIKDVTDMGYSLHTRRAIRARKRRAHQFLVDSFQGSQGSHSTGRAIEANGDFVHSSNAQTQPTRSRSEAKASRSAGVPGWATLVWNYSRLLPFLAGELAILGAQDKAVDQNARDGNEQARPKRHIAHKIEQ